MTERGNSLALVSITLYRRYGYYMTSVYVPTSMLVLISYASLFCDIESKDLRIMMTITTLLVLYSLYQQISSGLPKTSYAKAVDIWCFFSLTVICSLVRFLALGWWTRAEGSIPGGGKRSFLTTSLLGFWLLSLGYISHRTCPAT